MLARYADILQWNGLTRNCQSGSGVVQAGLSDHQRLASKQSMQSMGTQEMAPVAGSHFRCRTLSSCGAEHCPHVKPSKYMSSEGNGASCAEHW